MHASTCFIFMLIVSIIQATFIAPKRSRPSEASLQSIVQNCRRGDYQRLEALFIGNTNIQSDSELVKKCFRIAVKNNHVELVRLIMENFGITKTELQWAVSESFRRRNIALVSMLAFDGFFQEHGNHYSLRYAHTGVYWKILNEIFEDLGFKGLISAAQFGNLEFLQKHISFYRDKDYAHGAILIYVINEGHLHILDWLLEAEEGLFREMVQTGLIADRKLSGMIRIIETVKTDNVKELQKILEGNNPNFQWVNFIRSSQAASCMQLSIKWRSAKIFRFLSNALCNLAQIITVKRDIVPSLLYLNSSICGGIKQLSAERRPDFIKYLLHSDLTMLLPTNTLLIEMLPEALDRELFGCLLHELSAFSASELSVLFIRYGSLRTKIEVLYNLAVAVDTVDLNKIFAFMDCHADLVVLHEQIWYEIFQCSDKFISFINQVHVY